MLNNTHAHDKIKEKYIRFLKLERSASPNTIDAYIRDVQKLFDYVETEGKDVTEVSLTDLQTFAATLHDIGICPLTRGTKVYNIDANAYKKNRI